MLIPPIKLPPIREDKVKKAVDFIEYAYKLIFNQPNFILEGELLKSLNKEYSLIRQVDDLLDGDTDIYLSNQEKINLIDWYKNQGGIQETTDHWLAEMSNSSSFDKIIKMHDTKHSHLLKLLKDVVNNQILHLSMTSVEIEIRLNIFNSIKTLRDSNCEIKSLYEDIENKDNNFVSDLLNIGFEFNQINAMFDNLISKVQNDLIILQQCSGWSNIYEQGHYQINQYRYFYKEVLQEFIDSKDFDKLKLSSVESKPRIKIALNKYYTPSLIQEFWNF